MFYSFLVMNFRNKFTLVLNLILPIVFMLLFGSIFGTEGSGSKVLYYSDRELYMENKSWTKLSQEPYGLEDIKKMKADIVVIAKNGKIDIYYLNTISQSEPELFLFRNKYLSAKSTSSVFDITERSVKFRRELNELEYIMIGVMAISLLSIGMNAGVSIFSNYVRYGLFKRFATTPVNSLVLLLSCSGAQILTGLISSILILFLSKIVYKVDLFVKFDHLPLFLMVVISAVMLNLSIGVLLSLLFAKSAQSISSLLYTIFIFFSGVYFPISFLPTSLRILSYLMPPRYIHILFQKVYGIESISNINFFSLNVLFIVSGLLLGAYATKKFLKPSV